MTPRRRRSRIPAKGEQVELPDAELEVLACLWRQGEATARQVREMMAEYRPMAHGSMVTLLRRLEARGWATREKGPVGKAFVYRPTRKPGPTYRKILGVLAHRIFGGNKVAMVANLLESKPPSQAELLRLRELLDELQARAGKRKSSEK